MFGRLPSTDSLLAIVLGSEMGQEDAGAEENMFSRGLLVRCGVGSRGKAVRLVSQSSEANRVLGAGIRGGRQEDFCFIEQRVQQAFDRRGGKAFKS